MRDFNGKREAAKKTFEAFIIERLPSDAITKDEFGNYKALSIHQHYLVWDHQQRKIEELQQQNADLVTAANKVANGRHQSVTELKEALIELRKAIAKAGA